jgi:hypothetical protein
MNLEEVMQEFLACRLPRHAMETGDEMVQGVRGNESRDRWRSAAKDTEATL